MWKHYENVSVKWVCQIKNTGVVTGIDTWTLLNTRNFRSGIEVSSTLVSNGPSLVNNVYGAAVHTCFYQCCSFDPFLNEGLNSILNIHPSINNY